MEWISVKDRLPEEKDGNSFGSIIAQHVEDSEALTWSISDIRENPENFIRWMSYPKLPKGE